MTRSVRVLPTWHRTLPGSSSTRKPQPTSTHSAYDRLVSPLTVRQAVVLFVLSAVLVVGVGAALWHRQDTVIREIHRADHGPLPEPRSYDVEFARLNAQMNAVMDKLGVTTTTFPSGATVGKQTTPTTAP